MADRPRLRLVGDDDRGGARLVFTLEGECAHQVREAAKLRGTTELDLITRALTREVWYARHPRWVPGALRGTRMRPVVLEDELARLRLSRHYRWFRWYRW